MAIDQETNAGDYEVVAMSDNSVVLLGNEKGYEAEAKSSSIKWTAVFTDPTFGGECPPLPTRASLPITRFTPEPILEDLPPEISCMVSTMSLNSEAPAGTGAKAAQHLKRLSRESGKSGGADSGSGLGDDSDDDFGAGSDSGLSDGSDRKESKGSKAVSIKSDKAKGSEGEEKKDAAGPERINRRAATLTEAKDDAKKDTASSFGSDSEDKDLLSNPFASDSEEEREKDAK